MKPSKPLIISALVIGLLSTIWGAITWLPLALGYQVCQYSEPSQSIAILEFTCILLGAAFMVCVLIHSLKAR